MRAAASCFPCVQLQRPELPRPSELRPRQGVGGAQVYQLAAGFGLCPRQVLMQVRPSPITEYDEREQLQEIC